MSIRLLVHGDSDVYKQPDYLVLCGKAKMLLPIYWEALTKSERSLRFLRARYLDAVLVDRAGNIKRIVNITACSNGLLHQCLVAIGLKFGAIHCMLEETNMSFSAMVTMLTEIATSANSYSVCAQFYDSADELSAQLAACRTFDDLLQVLHVDGTGDTSEYLA